MPPIAVIGGVGVTIRLATAESGHRATVDIDIVADDREPAAIEVLAQDHERVREQTAVVAGIEVDLIPTERCPMTPWARSKTGQSVARTTTDGSGRPRTRGWRPSRVTAANVCEGRTRDASRYVSDLTDVGVPFALDLAVA